MTNSSSSSAAPASTQIIVESFLETLQTQKCHGYVAQRVHLTFTWGVKQTTSS